MLFLPVAEQEVPPDDPGDGVNEMLALAAKSGCSHKNTARMNYFRAQAEICDFEQFFWKI